MLGSCGNLNGGQFSPCDECSYKMLRISNQCTSLHCMYGLLNTIAKRLYEDGKADVELTSHPTFVVSADEESRDEKVERVLILQKEIHKIYDELDETKSEDFPHKQREIERLHDLKEELESLKSELGYIPE